MDRKVFRKKFFQLLYPKKFTHYNPVKIPFIAKKVEKWFFEDDNMVCLTKDNVIKVSESFSDEGSILLPSSITEHFVRQASYIWIMNFCMCRETNPCKDYPIEYGCVFMGEGARGIHPDFGHEANVEETLEYLKKCREAGLVHSIGKSKLDTVWLDTGPGEKLLTICNCCPCCCITKMVPYMPESITYRFHATPGVKMEVNDDCIGCGECVDANVCIFDAIHLVDDRASINSGACRTCGRCAEVCPNNAIDAVVGDDDFINTAIKDISIGLDIT